MYNPRMTAVLQPQKKEFERPSKIEYICFVMYIISIIRWVESTMHIILFCKQ